LLHGILANAILYDTLIVTKYSDSRKVDFAAKLIPFVGLAFADTIYFQFKNTANLVLIFAHLAIN